MRKKFIEFVKHMLLHAFGYALLGLLGVVGLVFYYGGPFSIYFLSILLTYFLLGRLLNLVKKRNHKDRVKASTSSNVFYSTFVEALAKISRVLCISTIPVLLYQVLVLAIKSDYLYQVWQIEKWIFDLNLLAESIDLQKYLSYSLFITLFIGLFVFYKSSIGTGVISSIRVLTFMKAILFFIGFSFFTVLGFDKYETEWRLERRELLENKEAELAEHLNETIVFDSVALSPVLQKEIIKLVSATIITLSTYELVYLKFNSILATKLQNVRGEATLPNGKDLSSKNLLANTLSTDAMDSSYVVVQNYSSDLVDAARLQRGKSWKSQSSLKELLVNGIQTLIPDTPVKVVNLAVSGVVEGLTVTKFELLKSSKKVPAFMFYIYMSSADPLAERVRLPDSYRYEIIERLNEVDSQFLKEVELYVVDLHSNRTKLKAGNGNSFTEWRRRAGKAIIRAL